MNALTGLGSAASATASYHAGARRTSACVQGDTSASEGCAAQVRPARYRDAVSRPYRLIPLFTQRLKASILSSGHAPSHGIEPFVSRSRMG